MFELRTWYTCLVRWTAIRYEYGRSLSASNASSNVVLLRRKDFLEIDVPYSSYNSLVVVSITVRSIEYAFRRFDAEQL
jgi:hypothetical protein